jgi:hypothetical protein
MSLDLSGSDSLRYVTAAEEASASRGLPAISLRLCIGVPAFAAILLAIGWSLCEGASPVPTLLAGYGALASTLALLLVALRRDVRPAEAEPRVTASPAGPSVAWNLLNTYTISDASRLWSGIAPGATATQESMAWGCALIDAVKEGQLPIVTKDGALETSEWERRNPHYMSRVTRQSLKDWAAAKGHSPSFLRD